MAVKSVLRSIRPSFLILTPVCVSLGTALAVSNQTAVNWGFLGLALLGALLAHTSVNSLNEYLDFESGLDFNTQKTEFSGGSGSLPQDPEMSSVVLWVGIGSLISIFLIGVFFTWQHGWGMVPIGVLGMAIIVFYDGRINRNPFACLVAPGTGFGVLMVVGTQFVLEGEYSAVALMVSVIPFFLVNNLLLLNQYPDIEADAGVGRNHFPIAFGVKVSTVIYGLSLFAAEAAIVLYVLLGHLPLLALIAIMPLPFGLFALAGAIHYGEHIGAHQSYLAANVAVTILTPLLLAVALMIAAG